MYMVFYPFYRDMLFERINFCRLRLHISPQRPLHIGVPTRNVGVVAFYMNNTLVAGELFNPVDTFSTTCKDRRDETGKMVVVKLACSHTALRNLMSTSKIKLNDNIRVPLYEHVLDTVGPLLKVLHQVGSAASTLINSTHELAENDVSSDLSLVTEE